MPALARDPFPTEPHRGEVAPAAATPARAIVLRPRSPIQRIRTSGLFDDAFYALGCPALADLGDRAIAHFHLEGWRENRKPNFYFDCAWYIEANADVRDADIDPLLHYIDAGESEGRRPCAMFDPAWYRANHAVGDGELALAHFLKRRLSGEARPIRY